MADKFAFDYIRDEISSDISKKVVQFWVSNGAIKDEEAAIKRAESLIGIVRDKDKIIGVATGTKSTYPPIRENVFVYKTYISKDYRRKGLMKQLFNRVFNSLQEDNTRKDIVGVLAIVEPPFLNLKKSMIWKDYGNAVLLGYDPRGFQIRIAYFPNDQ